MATRRTQRDGIDSLIKAGALPPAGGPMLVPNPTPESSKSGMIFSQTGPCGNPGDWCSADVFTVLPGWKCKLCSSCETEWRKAVGSL